MALKIENNLGTKFNLTHANNVGEISLTSKDLISTAYTVETIEELSTVPIEFNTVIVKDINRGGIFVSKTEGDIDPNTGSVYTANGGTVFAKLGGGFWVRQYSGAVNVKWFGAVGDGVTDDRLFIQNALNSSTHIYFDSLGTYKFIGEVLIPSNTIVEFKKSNIIIDVNGASARGFYFNEVSNSKMIGNATITGSAITLGTDGFKNNIVTFGHDYYMTRDAIITNNCSIDGDFTITSNGTENVKLIAIAGYCENITVRGVKGTGQANYPISSHWCGNGSAGVLPTKTWHPHNIKVENCNVYDTVGLGSILRSYTFSANGKVEIRNCKSNSTTLGYNLFVGDYGFTYSQNVISSDAFNISLFNVSHYGAGTSLSIDCISIGLDSSPVWSGQSNNATVFIDGFTTDCSTHANGLTVALTGLKNFIGKNIVLTSTNGAQTREFFYTQFCSNVYLQGKFTHRNYIRIRTTDSVEIVADISKPTNLPDVTSYSITLEGVKYTNIHDSFISGSRTAIYSIDVYDKSVNITNCIFTQIGITAINVLSCAELNITNNLFKDVGTTTTTGNIYLIVLTSVVGFNISDNIFSRNMARYLVYAPATAANGVIKGNLFKFLNTGATTPAAIFRDASAVNVFVDLNTNIVNSGINLKYPYA